ncbi:MULTISPECIES: hypothetical protein [Paraburkholderia]|uniref:Uncharacterized protein n=1 Tax=Paraburkholderia kirstenboschensis TaxID=1245436 RepID=A0ABZ0ECQ9_9BURK|nr:hypothetical protein [Paraburkholderia kirstenboschensis]WOD13988.1 hypothetical protein RW095_00095 [Paraburkholderia kirstenboschensis]
MTDAIWDAIGTAAETGFIAILPLCGFLARSAWPANQKSFHQKSFAGPGAEVRAPTLHSQATLLATVPRGNQDENRAPIRSESGPAIVLAQSKRVA